MIFLIWSSSSIFHLILLPLSWLYGAITMFIRFIYLIGLCKARRFPIPVVVIGNLTVGGNGKTPVVLWLVETLQKKGWRVGVVSRGYGSQAHNYPVLLNIHTKSNQCGDEPLLIWKRTGVPVAVSPRRIDAVEELLSTQTLDIIISDDGLQHYSLARDIEWVVIDGIFRFGNGWWLPIGPMRERATRLNSVQGIIVNGGKAQLGEISMKLRPNLAVNLLNGDNRDLSEFLEIVAIAGICHPSYFFDMLHASGIVPIKEIGFNDHQVYNEEMLNFLTSGNQVLLMTEKDSVKCQDFAKPNWWYLPVDAIFSESESEKLLIPVIQVIKKYQTKKNIMLN